MSYTYLLKLTKGDFYADSTADLKKRIIKHNSGSVLHTSKCRPLKLVWYSSFETKELAENLKII